MIRITLLTGGPHPFHETTPILASLLGEAGCAVTTCDDPDEVADRVSADGTDVLVLNTLRWTMRDERYDDVRDDQAYAVAPQTAAAIDGWVREGGRMLACHAAPICFDDWPGWGDLLGARWDWARSSHPPLGAMDVHVAEGDHPLVAGLDDFTITDECYGFLEIADGVELDPLLSGQHGGSTHPLLWARNVNHGRVVVCLLGHGAESFRHPTHAEVLRRAVRWLSTDVDGA